MNYKQLVYPSTLCQPEDQNDQTRGNQDESRELIDGNQNHPSRGRKFFITPNWFTRWAFGRIVSWEDCLGA